MKQKGIKHKDSRHWNKCHLRCCNSRVTISNQTPKWNLWDIQLLWYLTHSRITLTEESRHMRSRFVGSHRFMLVTVLSGIGSRFEQLSVWFAFLISWMHVHAHTCAYTMTHQEFGDCIDIWVCFVLWWCNKKIPCFCMQYYVLVCFLVQRLVRTCGWNCTSYLSIYLFCIIFCINFSFLTYILASSCSRPPSPFLGGFSRGGGIVLCQDTPWH